MAAPVPHPPSGPALIHTHAEIAGSSAGAKTGELDDLC